MARTINRKFQVRKLVRERADGRCEGCGVELTPDEKPSMHHRDRVAHGGKDRVSNLLHLCWQCHTIGIHQNEELAYNFGLLIERGVDASKCAVLTRHGWVRLTEDGQYQSLSWWEADAETRRCDRHPVQAEAG